MNVYDTDPVEDSGSIDERDERALSQYLTVLPEAPDLYSVVSESGKSYTVDARDGACTCPDFEYRDVRCKHIRRVEFETGRRDLPDGVDRDDLPRDFGQHVEDPNTGQPIAADGGEILEEPTVEYTYHVEAPAQGGERFVRCEGCGAELLVRLGGKDSLIHREGCPAGEGR